MIQIDFYRGVDLLTTIKPDSGSVQQKAIMGEDIVQLNFRLSTHVEFLFGDHCTVFGEKYIIQKIPVVKKVASNHYEYNLTARNETMEIEKAQYLFLGEDNTLRESDFALMGTATDFLTLIVANINRISSGWSVGSVAASGQYRNMTFSKETCLSALSRIAEEYETEFWIDGKVISLGKLQVSTDNTFTHGKGNGLYEIIRQVRDNEPLITRLYAFGSSKNLPPDYRSYAKRLLMTDGVLSIENNVAKYGIVENTAIFEDIYPSRTGTVTAINVADIFEFTDSAMDFDLNDYLLSGVTAKVTFNTGQLSGLTFQVKSYNDTTKKFIILLNTDNIYIDLPNALLNIQVGDLYVLTDIKMPPSYVTAAEALLAERATEFLAKLSEPVLAYQITFDPAFLKAYAIVLNCGDLVTITDIALDVNRQIRVVATTRDIVNESDVKVELSDTVSYGTINRLQVTQDATVRGIATVNSQIQNMRIFNNSISGDFTIEAGTLLLKDPLIITTDGGYLPLYWSPSNGAVVAADL